MWPVWLWIKQHDSSRLGLVQTGSSCGYGISLVYSVCSWNCKVTLGVSQLYVSLLPYTALTGCPDLLDKEQELWLARYWLVGLAGIGKRSDPTDSESQGTFDEATRRASTGSGRQSTGSPQYSRPASTNSSPARLPPGPGRFSDMSYDNAHTSPDGNQSMTMPDRVFQREPNPSLNQTTGSSGLTTCFNELNNNEQYSRFSSPNRPQRYAKCNNVDMSRSGVYLPLGSQGEDDQEPETPDTICTTASCDAETLLDQTPRCVRTLWDKFVWVINYKVFLSTYFRCQI